MWTNLLSRVFNYGWSIRQTKKERMRIMKTSKRFIVILTALMCMCIVVALGAGTVEAQANIPHDEGMCGPNVKWTYYRTGFNNGYLVLEGTGGMYSYAPYGSDSAPWKVFNYNVSRVEIKDGITAIGDWAFYCVGMTSVTMTDSVTVIGNHAFQSCNYLTDLTLSSKLTKIGELAFYFCPITQINLPHTLTSIGGSAFMSCPLKKVTLPNNLTYIGIRAFSDCPITEIDIPGTVKVIDGFSTCNKLTKVTLHEGSEAIAERAFISCKRLKTIKIPSTVKSIGPCAFMNCSSMESITVPENVDSIGEASFNTCTDNSKIIILNPDCKIYDTVDTFSGKIVGYANSTAEAYAKKYDKDFTTIKAKTLSFLRDTYTYNGGRKTPTVVIKDSQGKTLVKDTDYTYTYETDRKSVGAHTIKVTFKGNYRGTKTMTYYVVPAATSKIEFEQDTDSLEIEWAKVKGADGYRVFVYKNGKEILAKRTTKLEYEVDDLSPGTKYVVRVRAYMTIDGERIYAQDSATANTATKPTKPTLTVTAGKGKANLSWTKKNCTNYQIRYSTDKDFDDYEYLKVKGSQNISATIDGLKKGKTYYFKVRAYKSVDGVRYYGGFSKVKSVTVK